MKAEQERLRGEGIDGYEVLDPAAVDSTAVKEELPSSSTSVKEEVPSSSTAAKTEFGSGSCSAKKRPRSESETSSSEESGTVLAKPVKMTNFKAPKRTVPVQPTPQNTAERFFFPEFGSAIFGPGGMK